MINIIIDKYINYYFWTKDCRVYRYMDAEDSKKENFIDKGRKDTNTYIQYSALGFQMFAVIAVFAYIGYRIDESKQTDTPLYTAFLSLAGVFAALYLVIRSIRKIKN